MIINTINSNNNEHINLTIIMIIIPGGSLLPGDDEQLARPDHVHAPKGGRTTGGVGVGDLQRLYNSNTNNTNTNNNNDDSNNNNNNSTYIFIYMYSVMCWVLCLAISILRVESLKQMLVQLVSCET